jgi:CubicO group peptidase (beta-lactamase class C family)
MNDVSTPGRAAHAGETTLANWRLPPWNRWSFQHPDKLIGTAPIAGTASPKQLPSAPLALGDFSFKSAGGREYRLANVLKDSLTDGFVVLKGGAVAYEWYDNGLTAHTPHIIFSVSKSVTGLIAGTLVGKGQLDPDAPVTHYIPEAKGSVYAECTVRHVMDMTVSIDFPEDYLDTTGPFARYRMATGWNPVSDPVHDIGLHRFLVTLQREARPHGERFHYVSPNSDLLGWIVERAGGKPFATLLSENIWQPMGGSDPAYVTIDKFGAARAAGGICVSPHDLARVGELVRRNGEMNGKQIIPASWLEDIRTRGNRNAWVISDMAKFLPEGRYRTQWYVVGNDHGAHLAVGIHGQWIYIDPKAEMVIAKLSSQKQPVEDATDRLLLTAFAALGEELAR